MINEAEGGGSIPWVASSLRRAGRLELGVHAVRALDGSSRGAPVKLHEVLAVSPASRKFLSMVMTNLGHARIIHSTRGHHGGYWLDRPLAEISLLDIVDALAPVAAVPTGLGQGSGGATHNALAEVWAGVDAQARALLRAVTIDDLAATTAVTAANGSVPTLT